MCGKGQGDFDEVPGNTINQIDCKNCEMTIKEIKDMFQDFSLQAVLIGGAIVWGPIMFLIWLSVSAKTKKRLRKDLVKVIEAWRRNGKQGD